MKYTTTIKTLITCLYISPMTLMGEEVIKEEVKEPAAQKEIKWENLLAGDDINTLWKAATNRKGKAGKEIGSRWNFNDGVLSLDMNRDGKGGSIETKKNYFNFELKFEYSIKEKSNSGVKYRLKNSIGLEYQIIDDDNYRDNKKPSHRTAGMYEIKGVPADRKWNPAGEWNTARIVANGNVLEHWLNGVKVISIEYGSEEWNERFEKSKYFKDKHLDFGTHASPIHIQDHSDTIIEYKNMFIRELK